jgi:hypothetical protein
MKRQLRDYGGLSRFVASGLGRSGHFQVAVKSILKPEGNRKARLPLCEINVLRRVAKIFSGREHATAQQFFADAAAHLLRPIHPTLFA